MEEKEKSLLKNEINRLVALERDINKLKSFNDNPDYLWTQLGKLESETRVIINRLNVLLR